jgi:hypothetical protein
VRRKKQIYSEFYELWQIRDGNGVVVGYQIADTKTTEPLYQVVSEGECMGWSVVAVAHAEPFEFVNLGFYPSEAQAFERIHRDLLEKKKLQTSNNKEKK